MFNAILIKNAGRVKQKALKSDGCQGRSSEFSFFLLLSLLLWGCGLQGRAAAPDTSAKLQSRASYVLKYLPSGRRLKIMDVMPATVSGSKRVALVLRYQSDQPRGKMDEIVREVDDIWDWLVLDAERGKYKSAIICSFFKPESAGTTPASQSFASFEMQRDEKNQWHCLSDKRVGGTSPAKASYREAVNCMKEKDYTEALIAYDKCISLDPKYSPAYCDRAGVRLLSGHPEKCLPDCDEAIRLNPENGGAFANRGFALIKLGQYQRAIADLTSALNFNYVTANTLKQRGTALCKVGKFDIGAADFSKAILLDPNDPETYAARSLAFSQLAALDKQHSETLSKKQLRGTP